MNRFKPMLWVLVGLLSGYPGILTTAYADDSPSTAWGDPDLQGIWTTATATPLERPEQYSDRSFLTESEDAEQGAAVLEPFQGGGREAWFDLGLKPLPGRPASMIVEPSDGRIPWKADAKAKSDRDQAHTGVGPYHSYLDMDTGERCISDGVTMWPQHPYNNNFQIFQTRDHIAILQEMYHEYRIIPLDGQPHINPAIGQWLGDARGHWEGETLVIETRGYAAKGHYYWAIPWRSARPTLRVTERLTRVDETTIDYRFTIEDPTMFTEPWTALVPMTNDHAARGVTSGPVYEFACHEGNFSIPNILKANQVKQGETENTGANHSAFGSLHA
jgi:hypothetical protein